MKKINRITCNRCKGKKQILDYPDEDLRSGKLTYMILKDCPDCDGRGYFEV